MHDLCVDQRTNRFDGKVCAIRIRRLIIEYRHSHYCNSLIADHFCGSYVGPAVVLVAVGVGWLVVKISACQLVSVRPVLLPTSECTRASQTAVNVD